jgi:pimeloyl-ACP methyl ester carboxylesterase
VDFPALLAEVESACRTWKKPTLLLFGQNDPFINIKTTFAFLDDMRTNFELAQLSTRVSQAYTLLIPLPWGCDVQCST